MSFHSSFYNYRAKRYLEREAEQLKKQRLQREYAKIQTYFDRTKKLFIGLEMVLRNENSYLCIDQVLDVFNAIEKELLVAEKFISREAKIQLRRNLKALRKEYINKFNYEIERRRYRGV